MSGDDYMSALSPEQQAALLADIRDATLRTFAPLTARIARLEAAVPAQGSAMTPIWLKSLAEVIAAVDEIIEEDLLRVEAQMRADIAMTGPEDEGELDSVPDPGAKFTRITVEEAIEMERAQMMKRREAFFGGSANRARRKAAN